MKRFIIFVSIICFAFASKAQQYNDINYLMRELCEDAGKRTLDGNFDLSNLYEALENLHNAKIDINTCSKAQLEATGVLNIIQIFNFLEYRNQNGLFSSVEEIKNIPGWSSKEYEVLAPFLTTQKQEALKPRHDIAFYTRFYAQKQQAYKDEIYDGNNSYQFLKYKYQDFKHLSLGISLEKDPGEKIAFGKKQFGYDMNSFFVKLSGYKYLKTLILGDFCIKAGQGLVTSNGFSTQKSSNVLYIDRRQDGIVEFTSANENLFNRGAIAKFQFNKFSIAPYFSYLPMCTNFTSDNKDTIKSIYSTSGLHRNPIELDQKRNSNEYNAGILANFTYGNWYFGAIAQYLKYDKCVLNFKDDQQFNSSINYKYNIDVFRFWGEFALDNFGNIATIDGVTGKISKRINATASLRYYDEDYYSFFSNGFRVNSITKNETGGYIGLEFVPNNNYKLSGYYDIAQIGENITNHDFVGIFDYTPKEKNYRLQVKYRLEHQDVENADNSNNQSIKADFRYFGIQNLKLESMIQSTIYNNSNNNKSKAGFMLMQNVDYKLNNLPLNFSGRFAYFNAEQSYAPIVWENDLIYNYRTMGYFEKGIRMYFIASYQPIKNIELQTKISHFKFFNCTQIGQGEDAFDGSNQTEIKFAVRVHF